MKLKNHLKEGKTSNNSAYASVGGLGGLQKFVLSTNLRCSVDRNGATNATFGYARNVVYNLKMAYEKLTYSGTECNNYLYFSFDSDFFDTEIITTELGVEPTSVMIKKDPVPKSTAWMYKIEAGSEIDLETPLEKLIDIFEPKVETINRLKRHLKIATRLQFVIDIDINSEASTPYFGLNKRTIDFLSKTETEVDFDLYKADTIGLLNDE